MVRRTGAASAMTPAVILLLLDVVPDALETVTPEPDTSRPVDRSTNCPLTVSTMVWPCRTGYAKLLVHGALVVHSSPGGPNILSIVARAGLACRMMSKLTTNMPWGILFMMLLPPKQLEMSVSLAS